MHDDRYRLPRNIVPSHYELLLIPNLSTATFVGTVTIDADVKEAVNEIILNALELKIYEATLRNERGTKLACEVVLNAADQRAHLKINGKVGVGRWQIVLAFEGTLNDKLVGFYRSTFVDKQGKTQVMACTQFESTDARRAFPCFDEPDFKATFKVSMLVDQGLQAISCGQVLSERNLSAAEAQNFLPAFANQNVFSTAQKLVDFAITMKMSTYVLAFVVGKLERTKPINVNGVDISVWCVPGKKHLAKFALRTACFALRYFERYFEIKYPGGKKLDLLAIPDFSSGAMENLGCITFREARLLTDEATASISELEETADIIAHEIAHMWFGNLVTMSWWHGLWLNEAFATFMAANCVEAFMPSSNIWDKMASSQRTVAMRVDALAATRPIEFVVVSPDDSSAMFDDITYRKGCGVMRMLEMFLGRETFRKGIAAYMAKHAYGNTVTADLWAALEQSSGQPVGNIMDGWILKSGFPIVGVTESHLDGHITLVQHPFKIIPEAIDISQLWHIPVKVRAKTAQGIIEQNILLLEGTTSIQLGEGLEWVVVNADGNGFFRVSYSDALLKKLLDKGTSNLSVVERVNLLADTWACVKANLVKPEVFLDLLNSFVEETDPSVWSQILGPLSTIKRTLPKANRSNFEKFAQQLLQPVHAKLGWQSSADETTQMKELRADIIQALAITGNDSAVQEKAAQLYQDGKSLAKMSAESLTSQKGAADGDMANAVLKVVAHTGDQSRHDEFMQAASDPELSPQERHRYLGALSAFTRLELLESLLQACLESSKIRTQDATLVMYSVAGNEIAAEAAWKFMKENWSRIIAKFPEQRVIDLCEAIALLGVAELEEEVRAFFAANPVKGGDKAIAQALELLRASILFQQSQRESLQKRFSQAA